MLTIHFPALKFLFFFFFYWNGSLFQEKNKIKFRIYNGLALDNRWTLFYPYLSAPYSTEAATNTLTAILQDLLITLIEIW